MSWHDRPYSSEEESRPVMRLQFPRLSSVIRWLIVINVAIFFIDTISRNWSPMWTRDGFGLSLSGLLHFCIWQPITYMFIHSDTWHLLFNMLGLYIFGSEFERAFGSRRLLQYYFACGIGGGLAYLMLALINASYADVPLIGASGGVYGLLMAAVIFFPHIQVVMIIFPMPIRVFAAILAAILLLQFLSGQVQNLGGETCHVAGALTAILVFRVWGITPRVQIAGLSMNPLSNWAQRRRKGAWERRQRQIAEEAAEVDRILAKVHDRGIASLNASEKKILERATRRQREHDRTAGRIDRL